MEGLLVDGALPEGQAAIKTQKYLYEWWRIENFTVVRLVAWPLNETEAGVDLVLIETSLPFLY